MGNVKRQMLDARQSITLFYIPFRAGNHPFILSNTQSLKQPSGLRTVIRNH